MYRYGRRPRSSTCPRLNRLPFSQASPSLALQLLHWSCDIEITPREPESLQLLEIFTWLAKRRKGAFRKAAVHSGLGFTAYPSTISPLRRMARAVATLEIYAYDEGAASARKIREFPQLRSLTIYVQVCPSHAWRRSHGAE